jgi:UPF0755 protein
MKKKSKKRIILLAVMTIFGILLIGGGLFYKYANLRYNGQPLRLYLEAGMSRQALTDTLTSRLGSDYGQRVDGLLSKMGNLDSVAAGSYAVEPGTPAWRLARNISQHRQTPVKLSFNNLRTLSQLSERVGSLMQISAADFTAATDSILHSRGVDKANYAGYFLPDTYEFYWTDKADVVVNKIIANYDRFWSDDRVKKAEALSLTPEQVSTLASIVEEETNKADERPKVARLYLNRLNRGMKLQADPTVKFAVGDFSLRRILAEHLRVNSPYNTYRVYGLPPGPIRLAEASTLDAVLNAPQHQFIYMCASVSRLGYHEFATSFETHQKNAAQYRKWLDDNGIK